MQQGSQSGGEIRSFRAQVCGINIFKLIVIAATLCSSSSLKMTDKELKLNLIGLNIIIAVLLQLCQEPEQYLKSVFKKQSHDDDDVSTH